MLSKALSFFCFHNVSGRGQSGAALLISLIILLLMTVIGVASMNTTILESKMAGNSQSEMQTFNDSESGLRAAEADVRENIVNSPGVFDFSAVGDGYFDSTGGSVNIGTLNWDADSVVSDNARYIIEYMGSRPVPGESVSRPAHVFQITARSINAVKGAPKLVRSIYMTFDGP